jgi:hypothetical protein
MTRTSYSCNGVRFKVGTVVRLRRQVQPHGERQWTSVRSLLTDVPGGVMLEDQIGGFRSWNVQDLETRKRVAS